jgi:hypothetical protein
MREGHPARGDRPTNIGSMRAELSKGLRNVGNWRLLGGGKGKGNWAGEMARPASGMGSRGVVGRLIRRSKPPARTLSAGPQSRRRPEPEARAAGRSEPAVLVSSRRVRPAREPASHGSVLCTPHASAAMTPVQNPVVLLRTTDQDVWMTSHRATSRNTAPAGIGRPAAG